jgi:hypothetical protein
MKKEKRRIMEGVLQAARLTFIFLSSFESDPVRRLCCSRR